MLSADIRRVLLETAWESLQHGLDRGFGLEVVDDGIPSPLSEPGASFVTLHRNGDLRGCIGSLEAHRPLISDVAHNAYAAGFRDPRFSPLQRDELVGLSLSISVLGKPQPISFVDENDLLRQLRPNVDGLILQSNTHRGTFLPSVWEALPEPVRFLEHLKAKAGLPPGYWSQDLRVWRYATESFGSEQRDPADRL